MKEAKPQVQRINRTKVPLAVAAQLQRLVGREYQPGDKLPPERVLGEWFGVGRSSIRAAISLLESKGLIQTIHGIGTFVSEDLNNNVVDISGQLLVLNEATVPELFEARRALEAETAALAAGRINVSEAKELQQYLERLEDETLSDEEYVETDVGMHLAIARATKNVVLSRLLESLKAELIEYSRRVIQLEGRRQKANEGHRAVVGAILDRDSAAASEAVIDHLEAVEREIMAHLEQSGEGDTSE